MTDFQQIADRLGSKYPALMFEIEASDGTAIDFISADFRLNARTYLSFRVGINDGRWISGDHIFLSICGPELTPEKALASAIEGLGKMAVLIQTKEGEGNG